LPDQLYGFIGGFIGREGAGQSTFFKVNSGQEKPGSGEVETGQAVKLAYMDQGRDALKGGSR